MLGKVNILCAVRDRRVAESLKRELDDGEHCTMQIVTDGRAVLSSSRQCAPDILVIDALLPGMDGLGVVDCLREMLGDRMPRVIGGSMMPFSDEGFRRRGARAVVHVPWQREELRAALKERLGETGTVLSEYFTASEENGMLTLTLRSECEERIDKETLRP